MNTIYKNKLYLIFLSFLMIISNSGCVDSGIGFQPKNEDKKKITEEQKQMFEEMAEKLKKAGSSAEEFSRYCGGEASRSGMARWAMCEEAAKDLRWLEKEERKRIEVREEALKGVEAISLEERNELYEEIKKAIKESVEKNAKKEKSNNEVDISLISNIFRDKEEELRKALKGDPDFFYLNIDCFVPEKEKGRMDLKINSAYHALVKHYMKYDPFDVVDF
jgi:hypothetical protein